MKKILVLILFSFFLSVGSASAFTSLSIDNKYTALALALYPVGGVSARLAGLFYSMIQDFSSSISPSGDISRPSQVVWIDPTMTPPTLQQKNVTAKMPYSTLQGLTEKTDSSGNKLYPNVYSATHGPVDNTDLGTTLKTDNLANDAVGKTFSSGGQKYTITYRGTLLLNQSDSSYFHSHYSIGVPGIPGAGVMYVVRDDLHNGNVGLYADGVSSASSLPVGPISGPVASPYLAASGSSGSVKSSYQAELDKMMQDPSYVPTFTDDTTGLPYAPPSSDHVMSPSAIVNYNTIGAGAGSSSTGTASTPSSSSGAGGASGSSTSPSSTGSTSGGSAGTAVTGTSGTSGTAPTSTTTGGIGTAGTFDVPKLHTLNFQSSKALIGALQNTYPFNMLPQVGQSISRFVATPAPPVFDYPLPLGFNIHIDLSPWDGLATMCRYIIASLLTVGFIMSVVNFWRGIS